MRQKKCSKCLEIKTINKFAIGQFGKMGHCSICKDCRNYSFKIYRKELRLKRPWKISLDHVRRRCVWVKEDENSSDWKYYKSKGVKCELDEEKIKYLWFRDKAFKMKRPHIDRLDSLGNYTLSNCHFMECSEHISKSNTTRSLKSRKLEVIS